MKALGDRPQRIVLPLHAGANCLRIPWILVVFSIAVQPVRGAGPVVFSMLDTNGWARNHIHSWFLLLGDMGSQTISPGPHLSYDGTLSIFGATCKPHKFGVRGSAESVMID
ncbi:hypothetical protein HYDPIDRAFT_115396 [Hydnomerulius pinastri MD-312]|uniref:Uncharacterized protein n=1 Tax=Hydnomerulius pinastri MD-312 TaxID=994086 RepID=A0A0C9WC93_9AGAM|nr:hypothetical protein HYDPIDRAFT_115396 [Hydnomerulius pinastri MD-312]